MPKFKHREVDTMFSDEILEKIFTNPETVNVPIVYQSAMIHSIEKILEDVKEENPNVSLSEFLSTNANADV